MLFAHIVRSFEGAVYETIHKSRPEDEERCFVTPTLNIGDMLHVERLGSDGTIVCRDGFGTFRAPAGCVQVGADAGEFYLSNGIFAKLTDAEEETVIGLCPPDDSV